jgi:hypothetical protein
LTFATSQNFPDFSRGQAIGEWQRKTPRDQLLVAGGGKQVRIYLPSLPGLTRQSIAPQKRFTLMDARVT